LVLQTEVELAVYDFQDVQKITAVLTLQGKDFADHEEAIPAVFGISKIFEFVNSRFRIKIDITGTPAVFVEGAFEGLAHFGKSASQKMFEYIQAFVGGLQYRVFAKGHAW
jgi:hypothetical protein